MLLNLSYHSRSNVPYISGEFHYKGTCKSVNRRNSAHLGCPCIVSLDSCAFCILCLLHHHSATILAIRQLLHRFRVESSFVKSISQSPLVIVTGKGESNVR